MISSIVISAVLFSLLGCASAWFGLKYKSIVAKYFKNIDSQPSPVYEDMHTTSMQQNQEKALELKENAAYDPV